MDPLIRKRCLTEVTVYPFDKVAQRERMFKTPYILEVYLTEKVNISLEVDGVTYNSLSAIYMDAPMIPDTLIRQVVAKKDDSTGSWGTLTAEERNTLLLTKLQGRYRLSDGRMIQGQNIAKGDEIVIPDLGRTPVKRIMKFRGLKPRQYTLEVLV